MVTPVVSLVSLMTAKCLASALGAVELDCRFVLVLFVLVLFFLVLFVHSHFIMCLDMIIIIIKMAKRDKIGVQASRS